MNERQAEELNRLLTNAQSIAEVWHAYNALVLPRTAGSVQRKETRRAFYAGIDWYFKRMLHAVDDEAAAERLMSKIAQELDRYHQETLAEIKRRKPDSQN